MSELWIMRIMFLLVVVAICFLLAAVWLTIQDKRIAELERKMAQVEPPEGL